MVREAFAILEALARRCGDRASLKDTTCCEICVIIITQNTIPIEVCEMADFLSGSIAPRKKTCLMHGPPMPSQPLSSIYE